MTGEDLDRLIGAQTCPIHDWTYFRRCLLCEDEEYERMSEFDRRIYTVIERLVILNTATPDIDGVTEEAVCIIRELHQRANHAEGIAATLKGECDQLASDLEAACTREAQLRGAATK